MAKHPSKKELKKLYVDRRMSQKTIGELLNVSVPTVAKWLREYDIPVRSASEALMGPGVRKLSAEELRELYVDRRMTKQAIADQVGVSGVLIGNELRKYGIPTRTARKLSEDRLRELYIDQRLSTHKIADLEGIPQPSVYMLLTGYGIPRRDRSAARIGSGAYRPSDDQLRSWYLNKKWTPNRIAKECGVSSSAITTWLKDLGIFR